MAFYIHFNNFSSFFDEPAASSPDSTPGVPATVDNSVEKLRQDVPEDDQVTISAEPETSVVTEPEASVILEVEDFVKSETTVLPEVEVAPENPVLTIENGETAAAVHQIALTSEPNAEEAPEPPPEPEIPETETEVAVRNDSYEKYHSLLKKFELSLRYRYDFTDVLKNNRETENSQNLGKLNEKNARKQRDRQQAVSERRFQEKQAENFRESLKQKLFTNQLQNKIK